MPISSTKMIRFLYLFFHDMSFRDASRTFLRHFEKSKSATRKPFSSFVVHFSSIPKQQPDSVKDTSERETEPGKDDPNTKTSLFQREFKYFKSFKGKKPDLSGVIDFCRPHDYPIVKPVPLDNLHSFNLTYCDALGIRTSAEWQVYTVNGKDGFYFVRNPFTESGQREWIRKVLQVYPRKPSQTNLYQQKKMEDIWSSNGMPLPELRWCTMGYHHNWATKVYSPDDHCEIPSCLTHLSKQVAGVLGFKTFEPEAVIINYYKLKTSLGGHIDESELDGSAPLVSFSFGQSAVFVIESEKEGEMPLAVLIRSGDITIMSGGCRFARHGIPLIVADDAYIEGCRSDNSEGWEVVSEHLRTTRTNLTVRQVYPN